LNLQALQLLANNIQAGADVIRMDIFLTELGNSFYEFSATNKKLKKQSNHSIH
jgi:hypothetical protein